MVTRFFELRSELIILHIKTAMIRETFDLHMHFGYPFGIFASLTF